MQERVQAKRPSSKQSSASTTAPSTARSGMPDLRGMDFASQEAALSPVQMDGPGGAPASAVHQAARAGTAGSGGALPHGAAIQTSFGRHDVSGVSAHVGGAASGACDAMGASAYASGNAVAFKQQPDLHTAAHEAAHVVQQRAGVSLKGGVGSSGDAYERHADAVADQVVQGKSAEGLLDTMAGGGGASRGAAGPVQMLAGEAAALKAFGGKSRGKVRGKFTRIRSGVKSYEGLYARFVAGKGSKKVLLWRLKSLIKRVEAYVESKGEEIEAEKEASQTLRRVQALDTLLVRLRVEQDGLNTGKVKKGQGSGGYTQSELSHSEDNKVGGLENSLDYVEYKDGDQGFYKPENYAVGADSASAIGISSTRPNQSGRALASNAVDAMLTNDKAKPLLAESYFATKMHEQKPGRGAKKGDRPASVATTGMFMRKAEGVEMRGDILDKGDVTRSGPAEGNKLSLMDPNLQRSLNSLQWLDALCGQVDRHNANFFVHRDKESGKVLRVTGIDNDLAFGSKHRDAAAYVTQSARGGIGSYHGLPPFADEEYANMLLAITPEGLKSKIAPYLGPPEVEAAQLRLKQIQATLARMKSEKKLIKRDEWDEKKEELYLQSLNKKDSNTYLGTVASESANESVKAVQETVLRLALSWQERLPEEERGAGTTCVRHADFQLPEAFRELLLRQSVDASMLDALVGDATRDFLKRIGKELNPPGGKEVTTARKAATPRRVARTAVRRAWARRGSRR